MSSFIRGFKSVFKIPDLITSSIVIIHIGLSLLLGSIFSYFGIMEMITFSYLYFILLSLVVLNYIVLFNKELIKNPIGVTSSLFNHALEIIKKEGVKNEKSN